LCSYCCVVLTFVWLLFFVLMFTNYPCLGTVCVLVRTSYPCLVPVCGVFQPQQPREGHFVSTRYNKPVVLQQIPYEFIA